MKIREATPRDYQQLCTLIDQVDRLHREHLPHIFQKAEGPTRQREYVLGLIAADNVGVFAAEQDGRLIGLVVVIVRVASDIPILVPRTFALIENICVDRDHRNQGIGRALVEHAQLWAKEKGADSIELTVYEFNNEAWQFYESMGYFTESRRMTRKLGG
ncbi:MAG: GNAT family N-acetyltransferase [Chloroflexota bacterium]|nr:GNAT family N-acetyltransferase [Chloroflexota bacterium]